ncbi:MAG: hypothetical protein H7X77_01960 [Anaerolineae bacterium]|nr:hypothetical protein [Anaerolineae bacterium]
MGATNGAFLLNHIPVDDIETEVQCLAILEQFASLGFCPLFREVIQGRVVEFRHDTSTRTTSYHWLEGVQADAVLRLQNEYSSAPYHYYRFLDFIGPLLTPAGDREGEISLKQPESKWASKFMVTPASRAVAKIQQLNQALQDPNQFPPEEYTGYPALSDYVNFHHELLQGIERCIKAGVIYMMGD